MFRNVLVTMDPLNNGMNVRENTTYMKAFIFNGYFQRLLFSRKMEIHYQKKLLKCY